MKILNAIIIGLGNQSISEHIPAVLSTDRYKLVALVDPDLSKREKVKEVFDIEDVDFYEDIKDALKNHDIDVAVIVVPHNKYLPLIKLCAEKSIHILKEKPFAISLDEAEDIKSIADTHDIKIMTCFQRRFHPIYQSFKIMLKQLGDITTVSAFYTISSKNPNSGWRNNFDEAGGGVLLDMGYHILDLLIWFFDPPTIDNSFLSINRPDIYDVDDTALFDFHVEDLHGSVFISCVYPYKREEMVVIGTKGSAVLKRDYIARFNRKQNIVEELESKAGWESAMIKQLDYFYDVIMENKTDYLSNPDFQTNYHVKIMEKLYEKK